VTLSDYVAALKRGWIIVLVSVVLALTCAGVLAMRKPEVYTSSTELFVAPALAGGNPDLLAQRNSVATQRVPSYVNVILGDAVANRVDEAVQGLGDASVSVVALPSTVVLQVTVTSAQAQHAADVARAYAEVVPEVVQELETVNGAPPQVRITTIDEADVPSSSSKASIVPSLVAGGILGLGLGFAIVMVREVLRRERAQAEAVAPASARAEDV